MPNPGVASEMPPVKPDAISFATHQLHFGFTPTDSVLANGTGFVYRSDETDYLVTNWHNVSGRDPASGKCLSESLAVPDMFSTMFRDRENIGLCRRELMRLYADDAMLNALWYEHPIHRQKVDVVALPLAKEVSDRHRIVPINSIPFDGKYRTEVADDAFIVGYPFSETTYGQLPIWKRASIASEPDVEVDDLPKMLVDTATRPGLSGSPVIMQRVGLHGMVGGQLAGDTEFGRIRNFIGIYSGRVGADESKAQLGIVWKVRVIDEIIAGRAIGSSERDA